ncbi:NADP-dependent phosphogluconate dehydrogenase [Geojedonia litorea]|uniref:6-phosphogluconate dehydrogenase, decarboxylating n=1 Tax=Geojedonia litorea TaxID=1268269 RepID=A0ABV9N0T8_9FLAO
MSKSQFGVIGLGVMGKSLSLNLAENGIDTSVYNRSEGNEAHVVSSFLEHNSSFKNIQGFTNIDQFVASLATPRKILIMVKAGAIIDLVIDQLLPYLSANDIIIDGGNSHYNDTQRRYSDLNKNGIHFIGCGVSGGEEGARKGPSLMPGGHPQSYKLVAPILESIAAKDTKGNPCCTFIGKDGAGHFVKMIHNGMEYAEMQLLAELYALLSTSMTNEVIAELFTSWNNSDLSSYLLEITIDILRKKEGDDYLLDKVLDKAGNKGTGNWSSKTALDLGVPANIMTSALFARYLSAFKTSREQLAKQLNHKKSKGLTPDLKALENAYRMARILNHHQGFQLMQQASDVNSWELNLSEIARIWTNGCIIRSQFMEDSILYLKSSNDLLSHPSIFKTLETTEPDIIHLIQSGMINRVAVDTFWSAYNYWISMTTDRLPANLIQAQRDYFGAHTFERTDAPLNQFFHANWDSA